MIKKTLLIILFLSNCFSQGNKVSNNLYITGDDGIIRMNVNIVGHVRSPGNYLVYDGVDLMTSLSLAGGYLNGANLSNLCFITFEKDSSKSFTT